MTAAPGNRRISGTEPSPTARVVGSPEWSEVAVSEVVCPECGSTVGPGRLSCAACGALLASVVGASRRARRVAGGVPPAAPAELPETPVGDDPPAPDAVDPGLAASDVPAASAAPAGDGGTPAPAVEPDAGETLPAVASAPEMPPAVLREWSGPPPASYRRRLDAAGSPPPATPAGLLPGVPGAYLPPSAVIRGSNVGAAIPPRATTLQAAPLALADTLPGGTPTTLAPTPAGAVAIGGGGRPFGASILGALATPPPATPARAAPPPAGGAPLLADLPIEAPTDLPAWLVVIGETAALASFLLPWASPGGTVLWQSAGAGSGYFDRWGLASLSDLFLFLISLVVLGLALARSRLPGDWRFGIVPLVLAGVDLGVGWLYLGADFGYGPGIPVLLIGAFLMLVGGILAVRHATPSPPVT